MLSTVVCFQTSPDGPSCRLGVMRSGLPCRLATSLQRCSPVQRQPSVVWVEPTCICKAALIDFSGQGIWGHQRDTTSPIGFPGAGCTLGARFARGSRGYVTRNRCGASDERLRWSRCCRDGAALPRLQKCTALFLEWLAAPQEFRHTFSH